MGYFETPYNIPSPDPLYAGSYREMTFKLENPFSDNDIDLTLVNVIFKMTMFGNYENEVVLNFSTADAVERIVVDSNNHDTVTIKLLASDTIDFEDTWYDFQIALSPSDPNKYCVVGQGKIKVYKKL